jgi:hypothetical protein
MSLANDPQRTFSALIHTKTPIEELLEDSLPSKITRQGSPPEGVLTRRVMKIHMTWKV